MPEEVAVGSARLPGPSLLWLASSWPAAHFISHRSGGTCPLCAGLQSWSRGSPVVPAPEESGSFELPAVSFVGKKWVGQTQDEHSSLVFVYSTCGFQATWPKMGTWFPRGGPLWGNPQHCKTVVRVSLGLSSHQSRGHFPTPKPRNV